MTAKNILQVLEQYQKARSTFTQSVNELASRPTNAEYLLKGEILKLLTPLLSDPLPSIQNNAVMALGKLAGQDCEIALTIAQHGMIANIIQDMEKKSSYYKKSAMVCLKNIVKHNAELAKEVTQIEGLQSMINCLKNTDSGIKEAAACALLNVACHNADLARVVEKAGVIHLLVQCLQEPEIFLKQTACLALCEITKHSIDLAQSIVDAHAIPELVKLASQNNPKLKSQAYTTLGHISKHSIDLSEAVVVAEVLPQALLDMAHRDQIVKRSATTLIRNIVKHNIQLAQLVVNSGAVGMLIDIIEENDQRTILPAIVTVGYLAAHSDKFAFTLIASELVPKLAKIIQDDTQDHIMAATVWALGNLGRHSAEHARHLAIANVFMRLVELMISDQSSEDLKEKCRATLKYTLQKCTELSALGPLLHSAPLDIAKYAFCQFSKILPNNPVARRLFLSSGSLKKIQEIQAEPGSSLMEYITIINNCYPEEIIRYYSPNYPDILLEQLDAYVPQIPKVLSSQRRNTMDETGDMTDSPPQDSECEC